MDVPCMKYEQLYSVFVFWPYFVASCWWVSEKLQAIMVLKSQTPPLVETQTPVSTEGRQQKYLILQFICFPITAKKNHQNQLNIVTNINSFFLFFFAIIHTLAWVRVC